MKITIPIIANDLHKLTIPDSDVLNCVSIVYEESINQYYLCATNRLAIATVPLEIDEDFDFIPNVLIDAKTWKEITDTNKVYNKNSDTILYIERIIIPPTSDLDIETQKLNLYIESNGIKISWQIPEFSTKFPPVFDIISPDKFVSADGESIDKFRNYPALEFICKTKLPYTVILWKNFLVFMHEQCSVYLYEKTGV